MDAPHRFLRPVTALRRARHDFFLFIIPCRLGEGNAFFLGAPPVPGKKPRGGRVARVSDHP